VRDFNSTNGTYVNDERIEGEIELHDGDVVKVGPLEFKVCLEKSISVSQPTPPPGKLREQPHDDDSIAALLLEEDGSATPLGREDVNEEEVPGGTTIMDMLAPESLSGLHKPEEKKDVKKKGGDSASTSAAAAAILAKYQRRQRG
jgi:pSer/pThr/pTyr-binding forkhead associated (FHA) protein